jgi:hypothetical protein
LFVRPYIAKFAKQKASPQHICVISRQGFGEPFFDPIPSALFTRATILWRRFFRRVLRTFTPVVIRSASFFTGRRFAVRFLAMMAPFVKRSL